MTEEKKINKINMFVNTELQSLINYVTVVESGVNISEHRPITMFLDLSSFANEINSSIKSLNVKILNSDPDEIRVSYMSTID